MNENMMNDDSQMNATPLEKKSNLLAILGVVAIVAIVAFVMIQASSNNTVPSPTPASSPTDVMEEPAPTPSVQENGEEAMEEEVVEIDMEAGSFYYTPNQITVKVGQLVRINLTAVDMRHNITLDEFGVESAVISEGESTTIEFLADQVGEFEFYCNVMTHRALGQVGTLIVEE